MTPSVPHVDARLSALETRVEGIAGSLTNVATTLTALGEKLDRGKQTPWGVIWSALGVAMTVLTVVGGLAYWPIKEGQADLRASILLMQERSDRRVEALAAGVVPRAEHQEHWRRQERDFGFLRERVARVEEQIEKRLDRLEAPRFRP
ncbi:hypothetical protein [Methylobacterium sp. JK268]